MRLQVGLEIVFEFPLELTAVREERVPLALAVLAVKQLVQGEAVIGKSAD